MHFLHAIERGVGVIWGVTQVSQVSLGVYHGTVQCRALLEYAAVGVVGSSRTTRRAHGPRSRLTRLGTPGAQDATAGGGV